jgi:hypothetical protein
MEWRTLYFINLEPRGRVHPNTVIFCGVFSILFAARISGAAMGGEEVGGRNMINMTIESCTILLWIFSKTGIYLFGRREEYIF